MSKKRYYSKNNNNQSNVKTQEINNSAQIPPELRDAPPLTDKELKEFMSWTSEIMNAYSNKAGYPSTFTPMLTGERLSEIGFTPVELDAATLKKALQDPITQSEMLVSYAEWLQFSEPISKRALGYMGNLPSFDYTFVCKNAPKDRKDKQYLSDLSIVKDFLYRFDVKGEFSKIHRRTMTIDAYYGVFRMDAGFNYTFQELPATNCTITGNSSDWGPIFDFNMEWFLKQGLSIDQYPKAMKSLWARVFGSNKGLADYDPANRIDERRGTFSTWAQTSPLPKDGGFTCFKFNRDIFAAIPFLTPLFNDAINKNLVRELQTNQYIIASQKILVGLIPMLKEQKSGQVKDALALDPNTMRLYLGFLKKGLNDAIKISGVPFSDLKDINYELPQKNMLNDYNVNLGAASGVTSRVAFASDKMSAAEVKYNILTDSIIATSPLPQYGIWLSSMINSLTKVYKFKFTFKGTQFDREERLTSALKQAENGIVDFQEIASARGENVFEMEERLAESANSDIFQYLRLLPNAHTASFGDRGGGREKKETTEVADSTARSDDYEGGDG